MADINQPFMIYDHNSGSQYNEQLPEFIEIENFKVIDSNSAPILSNFGVWPDKINIVENSSIDNFIFKANSSDPDGDELHYYLEGPDMISFK